MPNLHLEYLFEDDEQLDPTALPDYTTLDFVSNGSHIYGEIMWPSENYPKPHPCVIMLHGFPGTARNDDISHALCRIGCVVIVPHNRGAWGSEESIQLRTALKMHKIWLNMFIQKNF